MKHSIKVIQNREEQTVKVNDLLMALPALKYHGNYKKYIPLVLQKARSIRDRDQMIQISSLITQMLRFPDSQVRQETHFQIHCLVQDILGKY